MNTEQQIEVITLTQQTDNTKDGSLLHTALKTNQFDNLYPENQKKLLTEKHINQSDHKGNTPLHLLTKYHSPDLYFNNLVKQFKKNIDKKNNKDQLPIHIVIDRAIQNSEEKKLDFNPAIATLFNEDKQNISRKDIIKYIIDKGQNEETILTYLCEQNTPLFIDRGNDHELKQKQLLAQKEILQYAIDKGNVKTFHLLYNKINNINKQSIAEYAIKNNKLEIIEYLCNDNTTYKTNNPIDTTSATIFALKEERDDEIITYLHTKAPNNIELSNTKMSRDIKLLDSENNTNNNNTSLHNVITQYYTKTNYKFEIDYFNRLVNHLKNNANETNKEGKLPIHLAIDRAIQNSEQGLDFNTAIATLFNENKQNISRKDIIKYIIDKGQNEETILTYLCEKNTPLFIDRGNDQELKQKQLLAQKEILQYAIDTCSIETFINLHKKIKHQDNNNDIAKYAIEKNKPDIINYLAGNENFNQPPQPVNIANVINQYNLLHNTILNEYNWFKSIFYTDHNQKNQEAIKSLIDNFKADPNKKNQQGETPLTFAVLNNKPESLNVLLLNGADPNKENKQRETPLTLAVEQNNEQMVKAICTDQNQNNPNRINISPKTLMQAEKAALKNNNPLIMKYLLRYDTESQTHAKKLDKKEIKKAGTELKSLIEKAKTKEHPEFLDSTKPKKSYCGIC